MQLIPRAAWGAHKPNGKLEPFKGPVDYFVVTQTDFNERCPTTDACCRLVRNVQATDMSAGKAIVIF